MATLSITIPAAQVARVEDAVCAVYGYDSAVALNPSLTTSAFAKQVVIDFLKNVVKGYEAQLAVETARVAAIEDVETGITLT